jgi:pimeloyl-[acyl-carrier protein] methyl ester esterase
MLHSEVIGSGPDLLLLHGWGMNSAVWGGLAEELAGSFRVTLVDLPGHGHSPWSPAATDLPRWVDSVLASAPPRATWIGWSLGGSVALQAALIAPARVTALVMLNATPRFARATDWPQAMPRDTLVRFHDALVQDPSATLQRFLALQVQGSAEARALLRELRGCLAARPPAAAAALNAGLRILETVDLRARLAELRMPHLWLFGNRDTLVPWRGAEQVQQWAAGALTHVIDGAAHAPFLSHRRQCLTLLRDFLEQMP